MRFFLALLFTSAQVFAAPAATVAELGTSPATELLNLRDPFRSPPEVEVAGDTRSELEQSPVDQFKMLGVATGPKKIKAMIQDSKGKTHFVSENTKIGQRKGIVRKITAQSVIVKERIINVLGQEEDVDYEIKLNK
jgi:Tfp pilus assembly protein PilP